MSDVTIRRGQLGDVPALTEIYNHYVVETPITFDIEPYTIEGRRPWLEQFSPDGPHRCFVAEHEGIAVGWGASIPFRRKAAYDSSIETSIYLAAEHTGRGLGTRLYEVLLESLKETALHRALAGITLPNAVSIALHERFGFQPIGTYTEVGFKFGRYWDVAWFEKQL
jgi:phosphinothricin acetyltransferase